MIAASEAEAVPILATLIQTGVAIPATVVSRFDGTAVASSDVGGGVLVHDVSDFGYRLLGQLRAADEDSERLGP
jgi:molybdopterin biosynthesis enzyme